MSAKSYASYLVRFWHEAPAAAGDLCWHGAVESVQSGQTRQFACWQDALRFLQAEMEREQAVREQRPDSHPNTLEENS